MCTWMASAPHVQNVIYFIKLPDQNVCACIRNRSFNHKTFRCPILLSLFLSIDHGAWAHAWQLFTRRHDSIRVRGPQIQSSSLIRYSNSILFCYKRPLSGKKTLNFAAKTHSTCTQPIAAVRCGCVKGRRHFCLFPSDRIYAVSTIIRSANRQSIFVRFER